MEFITPQKDIDWALSVEQSVSESEAALYAECMAGVPMSERVRNPRPLDAVGRDVRDGCILTGLFCRTRPNQPETKPSRKASCCDECGEPAIKTIRDAGNNRHCFCEKHWEAHVAFTGNDGKPYQI